MSGVWLDYKITSIEDQQKFCVPLNEDTETIYYDQRMIIDANVTNREPRTWEVTKVNALASNGLETVTLAQGRFDQNRDKIEKDEDGNVIAMWAYPNVSNTYESSETILDTMVVDETVTGTISFSGKSSTLKIGDTGYKKLTITAEEDYSQDSWTFTIDDVDASSLIDVVKDGLETNQIKVRFNGDISYLNKTLKVHYEYGNVVANLDMIITAL